MYNFNYKYLYAKFMTTYLPDYNATWVPNESRRTVSITYNGEKMDIARVVRPTLLMYQAQESGPAKLVASTSMEYRWKKTETNGTMFVDSAMHIEAKGAISNFFAKHPYLHYRDIVNTNPIQYLSGDDCYFWGENGMYLNWQNITMKTVDWYGTNA